MAERILKEREALNIESISWGRITWIYVEKPSSSEMQYLAEHFPFHPLDLDDCLSRVQRPKIDKYPDYLFMIFHFPVFDKRARVTLPSQVSIFLGEDYLITIHQGDLRPLVRLFQECKMDERARIENMGRSTGYLLYRILDRLVDYCFPILDKIGANIDAVEDEIFSSEDREKVIRELSLLRRDIISYRRMIKPQTEVMELLEKSDWPILKEDPEVYFGDLADHMRKIQETLDDYKEVIEGLNDTNNTLTSSQINKVMKTLTIISTTMLPLTLVASIYGMNLHYLPFSHHPWAFWFFLIVMTVMAVSLLAIFRRKRWL